MFLRLNAKLLFDRLTRKVPMKGPTSAIYIFFLSQTLLGGTPLARVRYRVVSRLPAEGFPKLCDCSSRFSSQPSDNVGKKLIECPVANGLDKLQ